MDEREPMSAKEWAMKIAPEVERYGPFAIRNIEDMELAISDLVRALVAEHKARVKAEEALTDAFEVFAATKWAAYWKPKFADDDKGGIGGDS